MLATKRTWLIATIALLGVSIGGYAYALDCSGPPPETLRMELLSVTYDGTPQGDLPEYRSVRGRLAAYSPNDFFYTLEDTSSTNPKEIEEGYFNAK